MTLEETAWAEMEKIQLRINPAFALPSAIIRENQRLGDNLLGFDIVTPEHRFTFEGIRYAMMGAQRPADSAKLIALAPEGNWGAVQLFRRGIIVQPEYEIIKVESPNWEPRPPGTKIDTIVLHHTGGSLEGTLSWFKNPASGASSHLVFAKDGRIFQPVPDDLMAWHAGKSRMADGREWVNDFSLGYEIVNQGDGQDPYPEAQLAAVRWALGMHKARYAIKKVGVVTHEFIRNEWNRVHPDNPGNFRNDPLGLNVPTLVNAVWGA